MERTSFRNARFSDDFMSLLSIVLISSKRLIKTCASADSVLGDSFGFLVIEKAGLNEHIRRAVMKQRASFFIIFCFGCAYISQQYKGESLEN